MLNNIELVRALKINLEGWDWQISNGKFVIDEKTANALIEVLGEEVFNGHTRGYQETKNS